RLHQFVGSAVLEEDLRLDGAVRHEDELVHGLVVGRHEEKRMMVDRRMARDLPDAPPGGGVGKFAAFRRITLTFAHTITMKAASGAVPEAIHQEAEPISYMSSPGRWSCGEPLCANCAHVESGDGAVESLEFKLADRGGIGQ